MKTFRFKEKEIREAALRNDSSFMEIRKKFNELSGLINAISKERSQRLQEEERKKKIEELKSVPSGNEVYLTSNNWPGVPYGTGIIKITDRRKFMACETKSGKFNVPYSWLSVNKPDESTIKTNRGLVEVLTGLKTK